MLKYENLYRCEGEEYIINIINRVKEGKHD